MVFLALVHGGVSEHVNNDQNVLDMDSILLPRLCKDASLQVSKAEVSSSFITTTVWEQPYSYQTTYVQGGYNS